MSRVEELKPNLRTVRELFEVADGDDHASVYTVPVYQRSYAWRAAQIEQLIDDIRDAFERGEENYFLGNLIVTPRNASDDRAAPMNYEVIDGQQRLTTLYLLLTYLARPDDTRSEHPYRAHVGRLRYESRPRSSEALRRFDAGYPDKSSNLSPDSVDDTGIEHGFNVIRQHLDDAQNGIAGDARSRFADYLLDNVQLVRAALPPSTDLNRYFEVMNTRGVQLQPVDIVKARLMSYLQDGSDRTCFAWIWDACADMDGYIQVTLTRGDGKLRSLLFGSEWSWLQVTQFDDLRTHYDGSEKAAKDAGSSLLQRGSGASLDRAIELYASLGLTEDESAEESERFSSEIPFPSLLLHALKLFSGGDEEEEGSLDDKRLITLFEDAFPADDSARVQHFAAFLLQVRSLFDSFVLKREASTTYSDDREWLLRRVVQRGGALTYRNTFATVDADDDQSPADSSTRDLLLLQTMLRTAFTSPRAMHWITLLLRQLLAARHPGEVKSARLVSALREHVRGRVSKAFPLDNQPEGFAIPRIVFSYLDYLLLVEGRVPHLARNFLFGFRTSVEHFYPQSPDTEQSGTPVSDENLNLLGNLALVSVGTNSKFSNSYPLAKATNFQKTIERQSPKLFLMADQTRRDGGWGDSDVLAHHAEMIEILKDDLE